MKYYTVKEVAKKLRVSDNVIYERIKNGEISKVPNIGRAIRIPSSEVKKIVTQGKINVFAYNADTVEVLKTSFGKIRKIKGAYEYAAKDIASAIGLVNTRNLTEKASSNNIRLLDSMEAGNYGLRPCSKGFNLIKYEGVVEYSKRSYFGIDFDKLLSELKPNKKYVQAEFEETKADSSSKSDLSKMFEATPVEIIVNEKGEPLFELYSTGMALGYSRPNGNGTIYPRKTNIDKILENAEIKPCDKGCHKYLTESQLYDFMFEAKTDKCKSFRTWVTNEVLPTIRKTGGYVNNEEQFTENYFSNLSEETKETIKSELENKNKDLRLEKVKIENELKSNSKIIDLINEA